MGIKPPVQLFEVVEVFEKSVPQPVQFIEKIIEIEKPVEVQIEKIIEKEVESPELLAKYRMALAQLEALKNEKILSQLSNPKQELEVKKELPVSHVFESEYIHRLTVIMILIAVIIGFLIGKFL